MGKMEKERDLTRKSVALPTEKIVLPFSYSSAAIREG